MPKRFIPALVLILAFCPSPAKAQSTAQVACLLTSTDQIIPCWANATYPIGVFQVGVQTRTVQTSGIVLTNLSTASTTTYGDYACTSTNSGVIDNGTNACPANQQLGLIWQSNFTAVSQVNVKLTITPISGGTGSLVCVSGSTIASCPISGTKIVGVFNAGTSIAVVNTGGYASVNLAAAATTTLGDYACSNALSAGTIVDNGTSYCLSGQQAGFIGATYGTPVASVLVYLTSYPYNPVAGSTVNVNGATVSNPNFNGTTPSASAGFELLQFQVSGSNVSGAVPLQLGNGTTVIDASLQSGADWCAKGQAADAILQALAIPGGTLDFRGLPGTQACAGGLILHGGETVLVGASTITESSGVGIQIAGNNISIIGEASGTAPLVSYLTGNGTSPMIFSSAGTNITNLSIKNLAVANFVNAPNASGGWPTTVTQSSLWDMGLYCPNCGDVVLENDNILASYGVYDGNYTPERPDITFANNANYPWIIRNSNIGGWVHGLVIGQNASLLSVYDSQFSGWQMGTAIYQAPASYDINFHTTWIQLQNLALDLNGYGVVLDGANYFEGDGLRSDNPAWQPNFSYLAGQITHDASGNTYKARNAGTSGSGPTTPAGGWVTSGTPDPATGSLLTTDNTIVWQKFTNGTSILRENGSTGFSFSNGNYTLNPTVTDLTLNAPVYATPTSPLYAAMPSLINGVLQSFNTQELFGGASVSPLTLAAAPSVTYHIYSGASHTTTRHYYASLTTHLAMQTGRSAEATITNAPDTLGVVGQVALISGGAGWGSGDVGKTITAAGYSGCTYPATQPVFTIGSVSGGEVTSLSISSGGTGVVPGLCTQGSTTGAGSGVTFTVDVNYMIIVMPNVTSAATAPWQYLDSSSWDVVIPAGDDSCGSGGTSGASYCRVGWFGGNQGVNANSFCSTIPGAYCDTFSTVAADLFTWSDVVNNTGNLQVAGNITDGAMSGNSGKCAQYGTGGILGAAAVACGGLTSPLTTEGDIWYYHSSANARLAVGSNNQVVGSNGTDPLWGSVLSFCPTCAIGPGSSTANHLAKFSGTDGLTLADGGAIPAGTITGITTSSPLGGSGSSGSVALTCSTCAIGPGSSTASDVALFNGTDGVTLKDGGSVTQSYFKSYVTSTSATMTAVSQNDIKLFAQYIGPAQLYNTGHVELYIQTVDNSSNAYDIGLYGPGCINGASNVPLAVHLATSSSGVAGSTFGSGAGYLNLAWGAADTAMPFGWYCLAVTSSAASPALKLGGNATATWLSPFAYQTQITGGGAELPATISAPALSWQMTEQPYIDLTN